MMHNFGIIADLNFHFLSELRQYEDCINKKKHGIIYKTGEVILQTIGISLIGVLFVTYISLFLTAFLIVPIIFALAGMWPVTVALIGSLVLAYIVFKTIEGIKIFKSQEPYYIKPIERYQHLIKRNKKPFGSKLTDFFRG